MAAKSKFASIEIDYAQFAKQGDILLASGVVIVLLIMLVPTPTIVLDLMLTFSISISMVILITSMFLESPMEFSIFPSLLLVTTLMRLALNVASTRLILMHGDEGTGAAGHVIQSFAEFVVGGNYVIGIVIYFILFTINKSVIVSGMSRIAEVAARFTLDSMPGKQMAVEADLNAGLIDEPEATRRREKIRKESDFYGAMDGAGKFVQGDVKAGAIMLLINMVGGFFIGVFQKDMSWLDAARTYTMLTIGDGLVATIPSLITATATGIIVSRAAAEAKMGEEFLGQLTFHHRALKLVSGILLLFGLIPGLPTFPFLFFAGLTYWIARMSERTRPEHEAKVKSEKDKAAGGGSQLDTPEEVQALLPLDQLELEVGYGLIPLVDEEQNGNLLSRIRSIRRQFALDMGVVIPSLHLRRNLQDFLGRQEVQELLNNLAKRAPKAVDNLVPNMLPLGTVQKVLQNLVREGVSIRDMLTITEALCDYGPSIQDAGMLTEYVRARMGRTIVRSYMASDGSLPIVTLSGEIDELLTLSLRSSDQGGYLALEPGKAQQVIRAISTAQDNTAGTDGQPVLLTAPQIRPHLAQLLLRFLPTMPVVSQAEIPADIRIQSLATVKLS
ncbi:MAG: EscV/YscV/HrcV family type III secretion system export apparatus protein [Desulfovibrionales bacterium GWA2_65_9]|nr:MAG: EscV/YscV/HrcV family type III secretion system export apparatus protein [Desulfovibrionales bacterium GWA2_65_9]